MKLMRGLHNLARLPHGCVATIGNFDGVHLGHQVIIAKLKEKAGALHAASIVITFEPQPKEFFLKDKAPPRLMRFREKYLALAALDLDYLLVLRFDKKFADMTASKFVEEVLVKDLQVKHLVIGTDFYFGKNRAGNTAMLTDAGKQYGFGVSAVTDLNSADQRVSSTAIRKALLAADMDKVQTMLAKPYTMIGRVAHGKKRGRLLGFPTANIHLHRQVVPLSGIYVVKLRGLDQQAYQGVAYISNRLTLTSAHSILEVHLFDFDQDIYGRLVEVEFIDKLREDQRFESEDELRQQILQDSQQARAYFVEQST